MKIFDRFPVTVNTTVAWGDMDVYGHVNNSVYLKYFEIVRTRYFQDVGFPDLLAPGGVGIILADINCHFSFPLTYPDAIRIGARVPHLTQTELRMEYFVSKSAHGLAAFGHSTIMLYDHTDKKKLAVPLSLKEAIEALEINNANNQAERPTNE